MILCMIVLKISNACFASVKIYELKMYDIY